MEIRTYLRHFDYALLGAVLGLIGFGMLIIYSATHSDPNLPTPFHYVKAQGMAALGGMLLLGFVAFIDFRGFRSYGLQIYLAILALILLVFVLGFAAMGSRRWIDLGFFRLQPSELAKVGMILVLSAFLAGRQRGDRGVQTTVFTLGFAALPSLLIFIQPDFGTSLVIVAITMAVLFIYGTRLSHFLVITAAVVGASFMVLRLLPMIGIKILADYQLDRLLVFMNPDHDTGGVGYHLLQSKIAIGSGSIAGKGLYQGTQTQLNFLPEHHTDFIFSVLGEELGFAGGAILLALYMIVIWRCVRIIIMSESLFGSLIAGGVVSMLLFQIFVNIGMTIGIMPITGIPLPFISYGGSSMVSNLIAIGLLESVHLRSKLVGDRRYRRAQVGA